MTAEVTRFDIDMDGEMEPSEDGRWISASDFGALAARNEQLEKALESIAANTCCENCQEAKLVAIAALSHAQLAAQNAALVARIAELEPAAECWDALSKCYQMTVMGSAGLGEIKHPHGYAHITVNLWTADTSIPFTQGEQDTHGRIQFGKFMEIAINNHPLAAYRERTK